MARVLRAPLILLVALVSVVGYYLAYSGSSPPAQQPLKIAVSATPLSTPFYVAEKNGYFRDEGLDVEMVNLAGGNRCFKALVAGEVDLATSSDSVIMFNSFERNDFAVLSGFVESDNDIKLIALSSKGIETAEDLAGKRVGVVKNSSSEFFIYTYMLIFGIPYDKVKLVPLDAEEMPEALLSGKVDAISVWEPFGYNAFKRGPADVRILNAKGMYNLSFNLLAMKESTRTHLDSYTRLLRALKRATLFIVSDPAQAQEIVIEYLSLEPEFISWIWKDYIFKLSLSNAFISTLESEARWALKSGIVAPREAPDFRALIHRAALSKADPTAVLVQ